MTLDLNDIRRRLAATEGKVSWRGLEQLVETEEFAEYVRREFPDDAETWTDPVTRRQFLVLMGASLALAGLSGCSPRPAPVGRIMPYVRQPEELVLGKPLYFATAMPMPGGSTGLLVESHEGRPTKIEGNPSHPSSLGATDMFQQAAILGLYDPDRSQTVAYRGRPRPWNEALSALRAALDKQRRKRGSGLRILTETITSPTLAEQLDEFLKDYPDAKWIQYEPAARQHAADGARQAFGEVVQPVYDFSRADVVFSLNADFLLCGPGANRYVHDFIARRRVRTKHTPLEQVKMNRLYVVESTFTNTGAKADHRVAMKASAIEAFAAAVAAELGVAGGPLAGELPDDQRRWIRALVRDLQAHPGASIVLAGDLQPPAVHALAHAINDKLGNSGKTVKYIRPIEPRPTNQLADFRGLVEEMKQRRVEMLLMLGSSNPVYYAPVDLDFAAQLEKVPLRVHHGLYQDETAVLCDWHIPAAHFLEAWSDTRAHDGTASIVQPLILPLYDGKSMHEFLAALGEQEVPGHDLIHERWRRYFHQHRGTGNFQHFWEKALQDGVIPDLAKEYEPKQLQLRDNWRTELRQQPSDATWEIAFRTDPTLYDGRFANNAWLQELPKPITKLTWDNAALISPRSAEKLRVQYAKLADVQSGLLGPSGGEHGEAIVSMIDLEYKGRTLRMPLWILPGHPDDSITIHLGHGRTHAGRVGNNAGFNSYRLRTSEAPWFDHGLRVTLTAQQYTLACTQMRHRMMDRDPARSAELAHFKKEPEFAKELKVAKHLADEIRALEPPPVPQVKPPEDRRLTPLTLYPEYDYGPPKHRWAMTIDLTACVGCHACVIACQAENNIPIVGKAEVNRGREMHWLRIDRYFVGDIDAPKMEFQPVPCMQCEKAPCELVCPVHATVHSDEGLNDMVYNRCVGTRYCSNNCPYKVRRFNFFEYAQYAAESASQRLGLNPDVTVRSRGVMEKCTYCVQRIREAEITAKTEHRPLRDGDVMTACQAACPAGAIMFGDLNNPKSRVYQWKEEPLHYALLAELDTQPRTTYLAALRNPNEELA